MLVGARALIVGSALALLAGCGDDGVELSVDLRTDLVAGVEVATVRTELLAASGPTALTQEREIARTESLLAGRRVGEFAGLAQGVQTVRVRLLDTTGAVRATRNVRVTLRSSTAVTVVVTHSCDATSCPESGTPDATECVGGRCTVPECSPENPTACPAPQCAADTDCLGIAIPCVRPTCVGGTCLLAADDTRCAPTEYCAPTTGCQPLPVLGDAGVVDAGGMDAGRADAGAIDAGTRDAGPPSPFDAGPPVGLDGGGGTRASPVDIGLSASSYRGTTCGLPNDCSPCGGSAPEAVFRIPFEWGVGNELHMTLTPGFGWFAYDGPSCVADGMSCDGSMLIYSPAVEPFPLVAIERTDGSCGAFEVTFTERAPE